MAHDGQDLSMTYSIDTLNLLSLTQSVLPTLDGLLTQTKEKLRDTVSENGRISARKIEENQTFAHGVAWLGRYDQPVENRKIHCFAS